jgi:hypothetical protein
LGKIDFLTAVFTKVFFIEFIRKNLFFSAAFRTFALERFQLLKLFKPRAVHGCRHDLLLRAIKVFWGYLKNMVSVFLLDWKIFLEAGDHNGDPPDLACVTPLYFENPNNRGKNLNNRDAVDKIYGSESKKMHFPMLWIGAQNPDFLFAP